MELLSWNSLYSLKALMFNYWIETFYSTLCFTCWIKICIDCCNAAARAIQFHFHMVCCFASHILDWSGNHQCHHKRFFDLKGTSWNSIYIWVKKNITHSSFDSKWHFNEFMISRAPAQTVVQRMFPSLEAYWVCLAAVLKIL